MLSKERIEKDKKILEIISSSFKNIQIGYCLCGSNNLMKTKDMNKDLRQYKDFDNIKSLDEIKDSKMCTCVDMALAVKKLLPKNKNDTFKYHVVSRGRHYFHFGIIWNDYWYIDYDNDLNFYPLEDYSLHNNGRKIKDSDIKELDIDKIHKLSDIYYDDFKKYVWID